MKRLGQPYYTGLLSAAQYHGAAHHRPQEFQVMVAKSRRPIACGAVRVAFVVRKDIARIPVQSFNTPRGTVLVSTPEATAVDLVGYYNHAGGLDQVATILGELAENLDPDKLAARRRPRLSRGRSGLAISSKRSRPARGQRSNPMSANMPGRRRSCCRQRLHNGAERDEAGNSSSTPTWRPNCDSARLHHRVAVAGPVGAGIQVEQDLVICRALVELFSHPVLAEALAFRGGTALYKLHLKPAARYSEDIDLVQMRAEPAGPVMDALRAVLDPWLGTPRWKQTEGRVTFVYRFASEDAPPVRMKLKVEINSREHFAVHGFKRVPFSVSSRWFEGACEIPTYELDELLGTKLRALYQRKKGRDLFDLAVALEHDGVDPRRIVETLPLTWTTAVTPSPAPCSSRTCIRSAPIRSSPLTSVRCWRPDIPGTLLPQPQRSRPRLSNTCPANRGEEANRVWGEQWPRIPQRAPSAILPIFWRPSARVPISRSHGSSGPQERVSPSPKRSTAFSGRTLISMPVCSTRSRQ